jgi:hypothetical protein
VPAKTYTAKYRDGQGVVREVPTGCRDETAARRVLADLERRAELVKAKVMTAAEDAVADHQDTPLAGHVNDYLVKLEADGTSPDHRGNVRRCLDRIAAECRFSTHSERHKPQCGRPSLDRQRLYGPEALGRSRRVGRATVATTRRRPASAIAGHGHGRGAAKVCTRVCTNN